MKKMMINHSLRVALVWRGTIYRERFFTQTDEHVVTVGEADDNTFSLPAGGLPPSLEIFERDDAGYTFRFTDCVDVTLQINGEEHHLDDLVDSTRVVKTGTVDTGRGEASVYEMPLNFGDWGVVELGDIRLFFQLLEQSGVVAGRKSGDLLDATLTAALLVALILHVVFLLVAFLQPPQPQLEGLMHEARFADFDVDDVDDAEEQFEEEEEVADDDATAADEDGEVSEPDEEPDEAEPAEVDHEVEEMGVVDALADPMDDGPLENLFAENNPDLDIGLIDGENGAEVGRTPGGLGTRDANGGGGPLDIGEPGVGPPGDGPDVELREGSEYTQQPVVSDPPPVGDYCDRRDIGRVVQARQPAIQHCYERELQTNPELSGSVTMSWRVELDGSVSNVMVSDGDLNDPSVEGCISRVVERMQFDEPDGGMCDINYPFVFTGLN